MPNNHLRCAFQPDLISERPQEITTIFPTKLRRRAPMPDDTVASCLGRPMSNSTFTLPEAPSKLATGVSPDFLYGTFTNERSPFPGRMETSENVARSQPEPFSYSVTSKVAVDRDIGAAAFSSAAMHQVSTSVCGAVRNVKPDRLNITSLRLGSLVSDTTHHRPRGLAKHASAFLTILGGAMPNRARSGHILDALTNSNHLSPVAFFVGKPVSTHSKLHRKLWTLSQLEKGWDGDKGEPLSQSVCDYAQFILETCLEFTEVEPAIVPLSSGGVQLEWFAGDHEMEVEIEKVGKAIALYENVKTGDIQEILVDATADMSGLAQLLRTF